MIGLSDVELLLRGWKDSHSRLRIKVESGNFRMVATCTIREVTFGRVALHIGNDDQVEFDLREFAFDFMDARPGDNRLKVGETIESVIVGASSWGTVFILLLE